MDRQDVQRRRALVVLQVLIYGYLLAMFLFQLYLYSKRDW